jgi:preprotein translocase subunit SecY
MSLDENLKKSGTFFPGTRPGPPTEAWLSKIVARITCWGSLGAAFTAAGVPYLVFRITQRDVIVTVLSVMVFVQSLDGLRGEYEVHGILDSYDNFLKNCGRWRGLRP